MITKVIELIKSVFFDEESVQKSITMKRKDFYSLTVSINLVYQMLCSIFYFLLLKKDYKIGFILNMSISNFIESMSFTLCLFFCLFLFKFIFKIPLKGEYILRGVLLITLVRPIIWIIGLFSNSIIAGILNITYSFYFLKFFYKAKIVSDKIIPYLLVSFGMQFSFMSFFTFFT
ncbi:hypothetical protein Trebr_1338 [Treponema brennaborense DSM 12168]|uniref:Yip1 domain-containing protein n=1 Tax=Treponema brennaborense (strain DSM 12168 / CIP 105900 / DD5/3) TaxID=906968 RepID=F4LML5_TREBD|nr:hypothetical protein Trebr_1338 [Treponema brennaborense DSM 12168]